MTHFAQTNWMCHFARMGKIQKLQGWHINSTKQRDITTKTYLIIFIMN
jgi:hypothetical protein